MSATDLLLLLALSGIWGSSFIFMRTLSPLIGPVATADARMFLAGVALAGFFLVTGFKPGWRRNARHFLVLGLLNSAIPFLLYSAAALFLPAAIEAVFNSLSPIFGALFAAIWLGERLTLRTVSGLLLGVGGVALMSSLGGLDGRWETVLSMIACLVAPLCYGLAGVYIKKRAADVKPMAAAGGSQLFGGLVVMPILLLAPPGPAPLDLRIGLLVAAFALLCSAIAYLIYYRLIATIGPTRALTVTFLIPVFAMFWGVVFLGEAVGMSTIIGAVMILGGTFLVSLRR